MYLISAYFDDNTTRKIQQYIDQVAKKTGNTFMLDKNVPPHITISAFETRQEQQVIQLLEDTAKTIDQGTLQWVSVGIFFPSVIYLAPVLNQYLHTMSVQVQEILQQIEDISISKYYQPFSWVPHATIGKKLSQEELNQAFAILQHQFGVFSGQITELGLAKTNPYENLAVFPLNKIQGANQ